MYVWICSHLRSVCFNNTTFAFFCNGSAQKKTPSNTQYLIYASTYLLSRKSKEVVLSKVTIIITTALLTSILPSIHPSSRYRCPSWEDAAAAWTDKQIPLLFAASFSLLVFLLPLWIHSAHSLIHASLCFRSDVSTPLTPTMQNFHLFIFKLD